MSRSSRDHLGQPIDLVDVGDCGQEDELVAACGFVATDEVLDRPGAGEVPRRVLLGDPAGEGVVVTEVCRAPLGVVQCEVALPPQLRLPGPPEVAPRGPRVYGRGRERTWRSAAVCVPVRVARHPGKCRSARPTREQFEAVTDAAGDAVTAAEVRELLGQAGT